jgi:hypothetical protein
MHTYSTSKSIANLLLELNSPTNSLTYCLTPFLGSAGDTGPLVYPAGFLYVFSALKSLTDDGHNLVKGQVIFAGFYILVLAVVLKLYAAGRAVPAWGLALLVLSKRIHSIFVLRMFNDCVAILLGYVAIYLFTKQKVLCIWYIWCCAMTLSSLFSILYVLSTCLEESKIHNTHGILVL